jgi:enamine deaminase RidA (YjgF/YER057c/UK114 family)
MVRASIVIVAASLTASAVVADEPTRSAVVQFHDSPALKTPPGFSHAVSIRGGTMVFVSGQIGRDGQGTVSDDFGGQVEQTFANLRSVLEAAGAKPEHVVKLTYFVVGLNRERLMVVRGARDRFLGKAAPRPTSTLAGVQALAQEGALVEIEAIAIVP